jgi:hypothetical protein
LRRLVVALTAVLLLATGDAAVAGATESPPVKSPHFDVQRLPGSGSGEPAVVVDPLDPNYVFVDAPYTHVGAADSVPVIWRSSDGGDRFAADRGFDLQPPGASYDTDVAIAPDDGTVYAINSNGTGSGVPDTTNWLYVSDDHGRTLGDPIYGGTNAYRPWLTPGPGGLLYLAYISAPFGQFPGIAVWRSTDHGRTFDQKSIISLGAPAPFPCVSFTGRPILDPRDPRRISILYAFVAGDQCAQLFQNAEEHGDLPGRIMIARSIDGGNTWATSPVTPSVGRYFHFFPQPTLDAAGNLYVVYSEADGGGNATHLLFRRSTDGGVSWQGPFPIDSQAGFDSNVAPQAAAAGRGRLDVLWYTSRAKGYEDKGGEWSVAFARSTDADTAAPSFSQVSVSPAITHEGDVCQTSQQCEELGSDDDLREFVGLAIAPDGTALASWTDDTGDGVSTYFAREVQPPLARPRIRLSLSAPRAARGGSVRYTARTTAIVDGARRPVTGVRVRLHGATAVTGQTGAATLVVTFRRPGRYRAVASKPGFVSATTFTTVR